MQITCNTFGTYQFCLATVERDCNVCCACHSVYLFIPSDSGMARAVVLQIAATPGGQQERLTQESCQRLMFTEDNYVDELLTKKTLMTFSSIHLVAVL